MDPVQRFNIENNPYGFIEYSDEPASRAHFEHWTKLYPGMIARKTAFIDTLMDTGRVDFAAQAVRVPLRVIVKWRDFDPAFDQMWTAAYDTAVLRAEAELFRRGVDGIDKPVVYKGVWQTYTDPKTGEVRNFTVKEYSDTNLQFLLSNRHPQYRSRRAGGEQPQEGNQVHPSLGLEALTPEEREVFAELAEKIRRKREEAA